MSIITISREFGSGGRELGKRLADQLHFAYYDKEILTAAAQRNGLDEKYVEQVLEGGTLRQFPITVGRTFSTVGAYQHQRNKTDFLLKQQQILKEFAQKGNCVIVGRGADVILKEYAPLNLFVYADMPSKVKRCRKYADKYEQLTDHELKIKIRQIDHNRKEYYEILKGDTWGAKENYQLCINTTGIKIDRIAPILAEYAQYWLRRAAE